MKFLPPLLSLALTCSIATGFLFVSPPCYGADRRHSLGSTPTDGGEDEPSNSESLSFEEQIARLNKQFGTSDSSPVDPGPVTEPVTDPPAPPSSPDSAFSFSSLSSASKQSSTSASSGSAFSIPAGIGVSTTSWCSEEKGFTVKNLPKSKAKGTHNPGDLQVAYSTLLNGDLTFLSAAEDESMSEELLGFFDSMNRLDNTAQVATTFSPKPFVYRKDQSKVLNPSSRVSDSFLGRFQLRSGSKSVMTALQKSCDRLGVGYVFLYQADFSSSKSKPLYPGGRSAVVEGLKSCKDRGLCENVGVKGVEGRGVEKTVKLFEKKGLKMDTLEVNFSLVNRKAMFDGTLDACKRNGVTCLASMPLGLDEIGSGKYTAMNPTGGEMGKPRFTFKELDELLEVHNALKNVAGKVRRRLKEDWDKERDARKKKGEKIDVNEAFPTEVTTSQVALNYVVAKGAVPLPSVFTAEGCEAAVKSAKWKLNGAELEMLDAAADKLGL